MSRQSNKIEPAYDPTVPKKPSKQTLDVLLLLVVVAFIVTLVVSKVNKPLPEITSLTLSTSEANYQENVDVNVECTNSSLWEQSISFNIYLNDDIVCKRELKLKPLASVVSTFTLDELEDGDYTVSVAGLKIPLTVHKPAKFKVEFGKRQDPIVAGVKSPVYYWIENVGDSKGITNVEVKADGKTIDTKEYTLGAGAIFRYTAWLLLEDTSQETVEVTINDVSEKFSVYTPKKLNNEETLMNTSVEGSVYFLLKNRSDTDIIVYITSAEDDSKALAAMCVSAKEKAELFSFPFGTYHLFVQKGENWIPELNTFATNRQVRFLNQDFVFGSDDLQKGFYSYWDVVFPEDLIAIYDFDEAASLPKLQD